MCCRSSRQQADGCRDRQSNSNGGPVCVGGDGLFWFGHLEAAGFAKRAQMVPLFLRWTWNNRDANAVMAFEFGRDADGDCSAIAPTRFLGFHHRGNSQDGTFRAPSRAAAWLNGPTASAGSAVGLKQPGRREWKHPNGTSVAAAADGPAVRCASALQGPARTVPRQHLATLNVAFFIMRRGCFRPAAEARPRLCLQMTSPVLECQSRFRRPLVECLEPPSFDVSRSRREKQKLKPQLGRGGK
jgi:hypothetical protein